MIPHDLNQEDQFPLDTAMDSQRKKAQDLMSERLKEKVRKQLYNQWFGDDLVPANPMDLTVEPSAPTSMRTQMDELLDQNLKDGYLSMGWKEDPMTGELTPAYTEVEIEGAENAILNRVQHLLYRDAAAAEEDGIITTDDGLTIGYAWVNDYLDAVLSMADVTPEQRTLIEAYKTTPTPESFEELWRQDPSLAQMLGKGAELGEEVLPEDLSTDVPVIPPMDIQNKEEALLTIDEDPRRRNEETHKQAKKEKTAWMNSPSKDGRLAIESWFLYVAGYTAKDFEQLGMLDYLHPDTIATLEAGSSVLPMADITDMTPELIEDLDEEELVELAHSIGLPWAGGISEDEEQALIDEEKSAEPQETIDDVVTEMLGTVSGFSKKLGTSNFGIPADYQTFGKRWLDDLKAQGRAWLVETKEDEEKVKGLVDVGVKALTSGLGPEEYKNMLDMAGVLNTQAQENVLSSSPWSRSMDEYRVAIAQEFNTKQGTDYEGWGDLMGAYFKNELSMMQEQWLMDMYDTVLTRTGATRGTGSNSTTETFESNTKNFHNNNNYDASKIGPSLFLFGTMDDDEWAGYWAEPTEHMGIAFNRLSNDWDAYVKEKAKIYAPDDMQNFIASYGTFEDQASRLQQGGSFFADPVYAEFAGRAVAKEMVNNPNSGSRNTELATKMRTAISYVANVSSSFDPEMLSGAAHFMISLKAGAEATGNYGWYNDAMTNAGGGTYQAIAYDFIFRTLQDRSGGDWSNLDPQGIDGVVNSVTQQMITLSQVAQRMTEVGGNTEVRAALAAIGIDPDEIMKLNIFNSSMGDLNTTAIDWKLAGSKSSNLDPATRLEYTEALANQYDEFLKVLIPIIDQDSLRVGLDDSGKGNVAWNLGASETASRLIWKSIENTHLGRAALEYAAVHGAVSDTEGPYKDSSGLINHDYDNMPTGAENRQQYELLNQYAFSILSSSPDRLDMFKGAVMTASLSKATGLPYDLNALMQHLDVIMRTQHGQIITASVNPSDQIKRQGLFFAGMAPGDLNLITVNTDYTYHVPPSALEEGETTYEATFRVWDTMHEAEPGEDTTRSPKDMEKNETDILSRNLSNLAELNGISTKNGDIQAAIMHARKRAGEIVKAAKASGGVAPKVGLTERHMLALRYLIAGEGDDFESPSGAWSKLNISKEAFAEMTALSIVGTRMFDDRSRPTGKHTVVFDENIRKETRGNTKDPHLKISLSMDESVSLPTWMNVIAAEYKDREIWNVDMPWFTLNNSDWGDIDPSTVKRSSQDNEYVYFTANEWQMMAGTGTRSSWLDRQYGNDQPEFLIEDPEGLKGGYYIHGQFKKDYAVNGSYSLVRVKIINKNQENN